jgi:hypothetical protein
MTKMTLSIIPLSRTNDLLRKNKLYLFFFVSTFNMGLTGSQQSAQRNDLWTVANVELFKKEITINKIKYTFGRYELGSGAFGTVYPARRSTDGLFLFEYFF